MPELPEVEVIVRQLNAILPGKIISNVQCTEKKMRVLPDANFRKILQYQTIIKVWRRAKYIIIELQNQYALVIHLGMSGRLYMTDFLQFNIHNHLVIELTTSQYLVFYDPRRFGFYTNLSLPTLTTTNIFTNCGIEPLSKEFSYEAFFDLTAKGNNMIKSFLMDHSKVVGIGNIYASEILFESRIRPTRNLKTLKEDSIIRLFENIKIILEKAIYYGGSTFRDYRNGKGGSGEFQNHFLVYKKESKPCIKCCELILNIKIGGRSSYFCPQCQQ